MSAEEKNKRVLRLCNVKCVLCGKVGFSSDILGLREHLSLEHNREYDDSLFVEVADDTPLDIKPIVPTLVEYPSEEERLKALNMTLFSSFLNENGGYYLLRKVSEPRSNGYWVLEFTKVTPTVYVVVSDDILSKEMEAYSKSYSYKHLKEKNIDVDNDDITQKGMLLTLLKNKDKYVVKNNNNHYILQERDKHEESLWKKCVETGKPEKISPIVYTDLSDLYMVYEGLIY